MMIEYEQTKTSGVSSDHIKLDDIDGLDIAQPTLYVADLIGVEDSPTKSEFDAALRKVSKPTSSQPSQGKTET